MDAAVEEMAGLPEVVEDEDQMELWDEDKLAEHFD